MAGETRHDIRPDDFFGAFITALDKHHRSLSTWNSNEIERWDKRWTAIATDGAVTAIQSLFQKYRVEGEIAAKGHPDRYGQSEYFGLDAVAYVDDWSSPLIAVEHENTADEVSYCCWKLLCIDAILRVLICYIDPLGKYPEYQRSEDDLTKSVRKVIKAHRSRNKKILCIIGKWGADPSGDKGWREVYTLRGLSG